MKKEKANMKQKLKSFLKFFKIKPKERQRDSFSDNIELHNAKMETEMNKYTSGGNFLNKYR